MGGEPWIARGGVVERPGGDARLPTPRGKWPSLGGWWLALAIGILYVLPIVATVRASLDGMEDGAAIAGGLFDAAMTGSAGRPLGLAFETLRVVGATLALAMPLGVVLALLLSRTDLPGRGLMMGLVAMAVFVPLPLHAAAWLGTFGNLGRHQPFGLPPLLVGWSGAAFVHAMAGLPWVILIVAVGLRRAEPELEEAALMDRPAAWVVRRITLRRAMGLVGGASLLLAALTAGEMTVTDLLQVRTYAEEAYLQAQVGRGPAAAAKTAIPGLVVLAPLVAFGAGPLWRSRARGSSRPARTWRLGAWRWPLGLLVGTAVVGLFATPIAGLVWRAGRVAVAGSPAGSPLVWTWGGLAGTLERAWPDVVAPSGLAMMPAMGPAGRILAASLGSPLLATALWAGVAASVGVPVAWQLAWLARESIVWRWVTCAVVAVGLGTPGPVVGMGLELAYLPVRWVHGTPLIVVACYVVRTLPYLLLALVPAVGAIPQAQLDAAMLAGLGRSRVGRRLVWPLTRSTRRAAWAVAFVLAWGELAASNILLPPGVRTLAFQVWSLMHYGTESHLAGVGLLLVGIYGLAGGLAVRLMAGAVESRR